MECDIDIPARPGLPCIKLSARIHNPTDPESTEIDPAFPTILLVCPILTDHPVHFGQFEDPLLCVNCNLVSFAPRGMGQTHAPDMEDEYGWVAAGEDIYQGMRGLGIESAHVVGQGLALLGIMQLASAHPEAVASMILINLQVESEVKAYVPAYEHLLETLRMVYAERNAELFEEMMHAAWGSHVGWYSGSTRTQDIFQHTVEVYLEQLLNGTLDRQYPYLRNLMGRHQADLPSDEEIAKIRSPTLFIFSDLEEFKTTDYVDNFNSILNRLSPSEDQPLGRIQWLENDHRWLATCIPQIIDPILRDIATANTKHRKCSISKPPLQDPRRQSAVSHTRGGRICASPTKSKFDHYRNERPPRVDLTTLRIMIETEVTIDGGDVDESPKGEGPSSTTFDFPEIVVPA